MNKISLLIYLLFALLFITSCNDDGPDTPDQTGETETFYGEAFGKMPALDEVIMYQANPRVFAQSNSLKAITARLDNIRSLGTNVLWLMPVNEQGKEKAFGSPYCIRDYRTIEPEYGTLEDLRELVEEAHKREMAVIMDWVANHTSWDHDWLKDHKEWYTQDPNGNVGPPAGTNWNDVVDLNYNNRKMREEMIESMKYWIREANIDGFRCDAADWVPGDFWRDAVYQLKNLQPGREVLMLAEGTDPKNLQAGFDLDYGWNFCDVLEGVYNNGKSISELYTSHLNEYGRIPAGKQKLRFITNHDRASENSPVKMFKSQEGAVSAYVISTMLGGVPLIYGSQEVGYPSEINFFRYVNIDWSDNPDIYREYQKIMEVYQSTEAFKNGGLITFENPDVVCFTRSTGNEEVLVIVNVRNSNVSYTLPETFVGENRTDMMNDAPFTVTGTIELAPYQYYILKK